MQTHGNWHVDSREARNNAIRHHPMSVNQVVRSGDALSLERRPSRQRIEWSYGAGGGPHRLVRAEAAAITQNLQTLWGVAKAPNNHPFIIPGGFHTFGMRCEHRHAVSSLNQCLRQIPNEGPCGVAFEARVGLGQEEKIQCGPSLLHSLPDRIGVGAIEVLERDHLADQAGREDLDAEQHEQDPQQ